MPSQDVCHSFKISPNPVNANILLAGVQSTLQFPLLLGRNCLFGGPSISCWEPTRHWFVYSFGIAELREEDEHGHRQVCSDIRLRLLRGHMLPSPHHTSEKMEDSREQEGRQGEEERRGETRNLNNTWHL